MFAVFPMKDFSLMLRKMHESCFGIKSDVGLGVNCRIQHFSNVRIFFFPVRHKKKERDLKKMNSNVSTVGRKECKLYLQSQLEGEKVLGSAALELFSVSKLSPAGSKVRPTSL